MSIQLPHQCFSYQAGSVLHAHLLYEVQAMRFYRAAADIQLAGYFLCGVLFHDQSEDFFFPPGEYAVIIFFFICVQQVVGEVLPHPGINVDILISYALQGVFYTINSAIG